MDISKDVEFSKTSSNKSLVSTRSKWKTKIFVSRVVAAVFLLTAMVFVAVNSPLTKQKPARLVEVDLKAGEMLTYQVDQHIELHGSEVQKATIRAIVGIRVVNKTSEEYWFMLKFKLIQVGGDPAKNSKDHNVMTDYLLVRLHITSRPSSRTTSESFEVFGPRHIDTEVSRQVHSILEQLFPVVQRNLYEDVDGERTTGSNSPDPEESPLLPGSVKMHREANTSDRNPGVVIIRNHFDRADFVNLSSEIDLDLKYSESAAISKSNGMVTESHAYFSKQLNFGDPIYDKNGSDVDMMKMTMTSQVSLIKPTNYFEQVEFERIRVHSFVKLFLPKSVATTTHLLTDVVSNLTFTPSKNPLVDQMLHNAINSSSILLKRSRRSSNLDVDYPYTLFEKKVLGITVKAEGRYWLKQGVRMGQSAILSIESYKTKIFDKEYAWNELQNLQPTLTSKSWGVSINFGIPVIKYFTVGLAFSLKFTLGLSKSYPSSYPGVTFAVQIRPYAEVTASIQGHLSALIIRAGVYGDGTILGVGLPATLFLRKHPNATSCATVSADLTALKLSAGVYYELCFLRSCGERKNLHRFGTWAAIHRNWTLMERCN